MRDAEKRAHPEFFHSRFVERVIFKAVFPGHVFGAPGEFGPNAVRSVAELIERLEETRATGYAINIEESEIGVITVAASIRRSRIGPVVGTVSVSGPSVRFTEDVARRVALEHVLPTADELGDIWTLNPPRNELAQAAI